MTALALEKAPSGIAGLDEITRGGLPRARPTLVCGGAGCGKTMFALQFLVRGVLDQGEPGVFMSFEETEDELAENVAGVGWDLKGMEAAGQLVFDHVHVEPAEIFETGSYELEGLFIRLEAAIQEVGAKRVVLDTLEVLFAALDDQSVLRAELRRLFRWLKDRGVTAVITAERGEGDLTRHGLEEYVSDCVLLLDHRVSAEVSTRRLRVVKYRGSAHDTNETPFSIDEEGFRVLPLSSMRLEHEASDATVSSGLPRLDEMLGGFGFYRGSSALVTGTPGSGKTTLGASFVDAACKRGERAMVFALEESPAQILRNTRSVGFDLEAHVGADLLRLSSTRPSARGLEEHLSIIYHEVAAFQPQVVVVDPLSAFGTSGANREGMLARLVDMLKDRGITGLFTSLVTGPEDMSGLGISSVIDVWIALNVAESGGQRDRSLTVIKARGTGHSNQVREYVITDRGLQLLDFHRSADPT